MLAEKLQHDQVENKKKIEEDKKNKFDQVMDQIYSDAKKIQNSYLEDSKVEAGGE
ncbi:MAG: hypothetical protein ACK4UJ_09720 [Leptonema sp. (in: bacteria)]